MAEVRVHPQARDWQNAYSYGARCHLSGLLHIAYVGWAVMLSPSGMRTLDRG